MPTGAALGGRSRWDWEKLCADARKTPLQRGCQAFRKSLFMTRGTAARGSRAAHQLVNGCGRAVGRANLRDLLPEPGTVRRSVERFSVSSVYRIIKIALGKCMKLLA